MTTHLTVGYDGSTPSVNAVMWAAAEAERRRASLVVVACYVAPIAIEPWFATVPFNLDTIRHDTVARLTAVVEQAHLAHPDVPIEPRAVLGRPRVELVEQARDSDLLVVGTTGSGAVESLFLGSVAHAVARSAWCPVVLVPTVHVQPVAGRVVVGIDGSPAADLALDWALEEADGRDAELLVVHAWQYAYANGIHDAEGRDLTRVDAALVLDRALEHANDVARGPVLGRLVEGPAFGAIVDAAVESDLVVVGSRGRGALRSSLFGSVAHAVAERSPRPVVVVRSVQQAV